MNKPFIILLFSLSLLSFSSLSQNVDNKKKHIKRIFKEINSSPNLKKVELNAEEFLEHSPDGGASLIGYFKGDTLVKITEWIGLSFGNKQFEYYFNSQSLAFVYVEEKHFKYSDSLRALDYSKLEKVYEGRFYFDKEKLISHEAKGIGKWENKDELGQSLIDTADKYLQLLKNKRKLTNPPSSH
jgi:hypothetical protein